MPFSPLTTRLMSPLATGMLKDADFTDALRRWRPPRSLKSRNLRQRLPTLGGIDRTELDRAVVLVANDASRASTTPALSSSSFGVSKK